MWNPAYRVNNGQYVSGLEEYLREFQRRTEGAKFVRIVKQFSISNGTCFYIMITGI